MKPQRPLVAERPLANHCPQLLRAAPSVADLLPALAAAGGRLAGQLARTLGQVAGHGEPLQVTVAEPRACDDVAAAAPGDGPGTCLDLRLGEDNRVLLALPGRAVLSLLDRAFGGNGRVRDPLPERLPVSAELFVDRIAKSVCDALCAALPPTPLPVLAGRAVETGGLAGGPFVTLDFAITATVGDPWTLSLHFPQAALPGLLGHHGVRRAGPRAAVQAGDPLSEPFAAMPLEVRATIIDMRIPFSAIAALEPGTVLPVAVARSIPLAVGGKTIACGTIGALDDRIAVQLTGLL